MKDLNGKSKEENFRKALTGKKIPVLTLDRKWYRLFDKLGKDGVKEYEDQLNELLKKQGKINSDVKDIKALKRKLMNEIVSMADEAEQDTSDKMNKKLEKHKALVEECNEKLEAAQDEQLDLPKEIDKMNFELMISTMENCYDTMQDNSEQIAEIEEWVKNIRIELKKRLIEKQAMEQKNHEIYKYMHDIFGAEVVNLFDLTYNPEEKHPVKDAQNKSDKN